MNAEPVAGRDFHGADIGHSELECYCGVLEERILELEQRVRAYELTIMARADEVRRLRHGLAELGREHPGLKEWAHDLAWGP
jgi:hypothetical protein